MPIHLTGIEPVATLPTDLSTYVDGYPVYNEADGIIYLARTDQATPTWVEASSAGGGGGVAFGHPAQPFVPALTNLYFGRWPNDLPNVDTEYQSAVAGATVQDHFHDGWNNPFDNNKRWICDADHVGSGQQGLLSSKVTLHWYAPVAGELRIDPTKSGTGTMDLVSTLDGDVAGAVTTALAAGSVAYGSQIQTHAIEPGSHSIEIEWTHTGPSATDTVFDTGFIASVVPTDPVPAGYYFIDDFTGLAFKYDGAGYVPAAAPSEVTEALIAHGNQTNFLDSATHFNTPFATEAGKRNAVGPGAYFDLSSDSAALFGAFAAVLLGVPSLGTTGTSDAAAFGHAAIAGWYAAAFGGHATADEEAVAHGNWADAGPQGTALGTYAQANRYYSLASAPLPTVTAVAGSSTTHDRVAYRLRGLDTNGLPTTKWSEEYTPSGADLVTIPVGNDAQVTWTPGDYSAATTHIEIVRWDEFSTFRGADIHLGKFAKANGSYTDPLTNRAPFNFINSVQNIDNFAYTHDGSVAVGYSAQALHPGSTAIGENTATSRVNEQKIGKDATTFLLQPGGLAEGHIRAVTAAHTCDSDGSLDRLVTANATSAAFSVTLPSAPPTGRKITIKKTDSSANVVTVATPAAETIDGAASHDLTTQWDTLTVIFNGTNWLVV